MRKKIFVLLAVASLVGLSAGKGKPGGGGGGTPPPADPAIAYVDSGDLMVMNDDGSNQTVVVSGAGSLAYPAWSPDGTKIAFNQGGTALYVANADGTNATDILEDTAHPPFFPAWSPVAAPDGNEKIVFNRGLENADGTFSNEIWLVNPDGTGLQHLTSTADRVCVYPTWSPDATRIAVLYQDITTLSDGTRSVTARGLLVLHLAVGTNDPVEIASTDVVTSGDADAPVLRNLDWARTGDRIVCESADPAVGDTDLVVIDLASPDSPGQLTSTSGLDEYSPSWSPDDSQIVFERHGSGKYAKQSGIYVMNDDGSGVKSLGAKSGTIPDWHR